MEHRSEAGLRLCAVNGCWLQNLAPSSTVRRDACMDITTYLHTNARQLQDMSLKDPDTTRLVNVITPSETLTRLLQNAAIETQPSAVSVQTSKAMTSFAPSSSSVDAVLKEVAEMSSNVRVKRQNPRMKANYG